MKSVFVLILIHQTALSNPGKESQRNWGDISCPQPSGPDGWSLRPRNSERHCTTGHSDIVALKLCFGRHCIWSSKINTTDDFKLRTL